jgi:hypothetical protein
MQSGGFNMINWNFDESQVKEMVIKPIPAGEHRVRIEEIEEKTSKSGNEMLKMTFAVSGHNSKLFHYLVFMKDKPEMTNTNLARIYDSFDIQEKNLNYQAWIGKVGAAKTKIEMYDGKESSKIAWFLKKQDQASLPAWVEGEEDIPF